MRTLVLTTANRLRGRVNRQLLSKSQRRYHNCELAYGITYGSLVVEKLETGLTTKKIDASPHS